VRRLGFVFLAVLAAAAAAAADRDERHRESLVALGIPGCGKSFVEVPPIHWHENAEVALERAAEEKRPVLVYVRGDETFTAFAVRRAARDFVMIRADISHEWRPMSGALERLHVPSSSPTIVIALPDGTHEFSRFDHFVDATTLAAALEQAKDAVTRRTLSGSAAL
jgi:hypothetical protein